MGEQCNYYPEPHNRCIRSEGHSGDHMPQCETVMWVGDKWMQCYMMKNHGDRFCRGKVVDINALTR